MSNPTVIRIGTDLSQNETGAINIFSKDVGTDVSHSSVGIFKNPSGKYALDVSGVINCTAVRVAGSAVNVVYPSRVSQDITGGLHVRENMDVSGTLVVDGATDLNGGLDVSGDVSFNNNLTVDSGTFHVDATNNRVGIGTPSPDAKLHVAGSEGVQINAGNTSSSFSNNDVAININDNCTAGERDARILFSAGGSSSSPMDRPCIRARTHANDAVAGFYFGMQDATDGTHTTVLCAKSNGNVGIGTDGANQALDVSGNIAFSGVIKNTSTLFGHCIGRTTANDNWTMAFGTSNSGSLYCDGVVRANGTVLSSDDRIKKNEVLLTNATQTLLKLRPQIYDKFLDTKCEGLSKKESGFIAQEVWYNAPELRQLISCGDPSQNPIEMDLSGVDIQNDPDYAAHGWSTTEASAFNYNGLIAYLVKSNQEQQEEIEAEKAKTAALETEITDIKARLAAAGIA